MPPVVVILSLARQIKQPPNTEKTAVGGQLWRCVVRKSATGENGAGPRLRAEPFYAQSGCVRVRADSTGS